MRRIGTVIFGLALALLPATAAAAAGDVAGCKVTGGGTASSGDRMRVNAKVTKGEYTGKVKIVTAAGDIFRGQVTALQCRRDGGGGPGAPDADVNIADVEGFGTWNGDPGHEFAVTMHDHGEGTLANRLADDFSVGIVLSGGSVTFHGGLLVAGNVQIHPPTKPHP